MLFSLKIVSEKHCSFGFPQNLTQPAIACSKLTTETLEQGMKHVES